MYAIIYKQKKSLRHWRLYEYPYASRFDAEQALHMGKAIGKNPPEVAHVVYLELTEGNRWTRN